MSHYENCSCKKIFSQKENRSSFRLHNNLYYICEVKVDNSLITSGSRCDWLYKIYRNSCTKRLDDDLVDCPHNKTCKTQKFELEQTIFIELKGENLNKAVDQIEATYTYLKQKYPNVIAEVKKAYAVTTRCPSKSTDLDKIKRDLKKRTGITLDRLKINQDIHL